MLGAGAGVAFGMYMLQFLIADAYLVVAAMRADGLVDDGVIRRFREFAAVWLWPPLFLFLTTGVVASMGRGLGLTSRMNGVMVGLASAAGWNAIGWTFAWPTTYELIAYPLLGLAGGLLGCYLGRALLAGREALYRASRDVGLAASPAEITAAVGRHLCGADVEQVALWSVSSRIEDESLELDLEGCWPAREEAPDERLDTGRMPMLSELRLQLPRVVRKNELPPPERATWVSRGIRRVLLVPLGASSAVPDGLLTVASRRKRFSRGKTRAYLTVGTQVALALENLRLVEQARRSAVKDERRRLAHEIHDALIQGFASIVMNLEAAEGSPENDSAERHLEEARRTAREGIAEARRMVWALRPQALEGTPLSEALTRLAEGWSEKNGAVADLVVTGTTPSQLPPDIEVTLLRAAQEGLTNVGKHANASRVMMTLSYMHDRISLDVQDDGVGFDPEKVRPASGEVGGFGLPAMCERAEHLGGTLLVESEAGRGTVLVVELPVGASGPAERVAGSFGKKRS